MHKLQNLDEKVSLLDLLNSNIISDSKLNYTHATKSIISKNSVDLEE